MTSSKQDMLRKLPQVDEVLRTPVLEGLEQCYPHEILVEYVREAIEARRKIILEGECPSEEMAVEELASQVCKKALLLRKPSLRKVINATGVVIHTNLGRSVLANEAVEAMVQVAQGYSTLEYNTQTMSRGSRHDHYERLICALTGAEAALAVNNNAAAVMMVLSEFAAGHEAIVSRGELVEIGGSFRVPDIMELSHASMVEVGTTNKTHCSDYENAITPKTAMLLKVHPSNYRMIGFTEDVGIEDLRKIADKVNVSRREAEKDETQKHASSEEALEIMVYEDQGSGALINLPCFGEYAEPTVSESLRQGCDLISFSGDKLLGGPQAGIIVGKKHHIDRLKKSPLARALRLDKMTLAALEASLRLYLDEAEAMKKIPTLRMLSEESETVEARAIALKDALEEVLDAKWAALLVEPEIARSGGGALPMCDIPTSVVSLSFKQGDAQSCERYLVTEHDTPVVARIKKERLLLDARTLVDESEIAEIARAIKEYFKKYLTDKNV